MHLMKIDKVVHFFTDHYEAIIEWSTVIILLLIITWVVLNYFIKEESETEIQSGQLDQLEETLKKILENGVAVKGAVAPPAASDSPAEVTASPKAEASGEGVVSGVSSEELESLKAEVKDRESTIEQLKAELSKAKGSSDDSGLKEKIQTLEDRLAEYEIIEDDIADLSTYKEENARLKEELEKLKAGGASAAVSEEPESEPEVQDEPEPVAETEAEAEFEAEPEVAEEEAVEEPEDELADLAASLVDEPEAAVDPDGDDLVSEFETAMGGGLDDSFGKEQEEAESLMADEESEASALSEEVEEPGSDEVAEVSEPEEGPGEYSKDELSSLLEEAAAELDGSNEEEPVEEIVAQETSSEEVGEVIEAVADDGDDDIFGEFATDDEAHVFASDSEEHEVEASGVAAGADASLESLVKELQEESSSDDEEIAKTIDTDKMLNEMAALGDVGNAGAEAALEEEMDVEKMAAEATKLGSD